MQDQQQFQRRLIASLLGLLLFLFNAGSCNSPANARDLPKVADPPKFSASQVERAGIRKLEGKHLTLYTDLPSSKAVDELPQVFDAAVPKWAVYFKIPMRELHDWKIQAYLMKDRDAFRATGMLPKEREGLINGFAIRKELWMVEQPTDYYRRHLLLHEGTHSFMNTILGNRGPGWYMEGMAEFLGTHRWNGKEVTLGIMPRSRKEVPMLGRIHLVQQDYKNNRARNIPVVLRTDNSRALDNNAYAWCWALAKFLDEHPRYQQRFRALPKNTAPNEFNARFRQAYANDWPKLRHEWQLFVGTLVHGHDIPKTAIDFKVGEPLASNEKRAKNIEAARGWQASGVHVEAGASYRIVATGEFVVGSAMVEIPSEPMRSRTTNAPPPKLVRKPWPCQANGITLEYYQKRPIGMLLGTVLDDASERAIFTAEDAANAANEPNRTKENVSSQPKEPPVVVAAPKGLTPFMRPFAIGLERTYKPKVSGTLYLKINESAGKLGDNSGRLKVTIEKIPTD